jgi:hypothetical protein
MEATPTIRFNWAKITTDEFAVVEKYDPAVATDITIHIGFDAEPVDRQVALQVKGVFNQQEKVCLVLAVTCIFILSPEDWATVYDKEQKVVTIDVPLALHLASLSLSTLRGVLHAKTEGLPINNFVLPPINVAEMVKEKVVIVDKE